MEIFDLERLWDSFVSDIPQIMAVVAENYTHQVFDNESFDGEKWKPRQDGDSSRNLLVGHGGAGNLKQSIRFEIQGDAVAIKTDVEYAQAHNEGAEIEQEITDKQRRFFWAMFRQTKHKKWRSMALKKTLKIVIPKRQFIGESEALNQQIEAKIEEQFYNYFKKWI